MTLPKNRGDREFQKFEEIDSKVAVNVNQLNGLVDEKYDEIVLAYSSGLLTTVTYKLATVTVATLTLSYTGSDLTGVIKT